MSKSRMQLCTYAVENVQKPLRIINKLRNSFVISIMVLYNIENGIYFLRNEVIYSFSSWTVYFFQFINVNN